EIVGIAASLTLRPGEAWVYPYYRDQALVLGLGVPTADILRQVMGKATDPASGGRTMPNHFSSPKLRIVSQSSPTGTQFLQAVGTAEAGRLIRRAGALRQGGRPDEVVYVSSGEGATSQGEFYEAVNAAILGELPVLFVIEDNEYAISVPVEEQTAGGSISRVLSGFEGLHIECVDGLDLASACRGLERAVAWSRSGRGPSLVHARVVRLAPHSDSDEDSAYRPERERSEVNARDPLPRLESLLGEAGIEASELESIRLSVVDEVRAAVDAVEKENDPSGSTAIVHVFDPSPAIKVETPAIEDGEPITLVDAIHRTLADEMERNALIVVFGEDVADVSRAAYLDEVRGKGGVFKVTAGLQRRFGSDRVFNTPLAEAAIVGRAVGMAVRGSRPVVEIQFLDFVWPAMNQIR
ncbi:MAG TPA: thiamine pyrophosphate-dependent enzyme, partial [Planctomycetota bacterium]|nr:thiamine pyrophosphate-dependent enzyme [Planctomycetota bacterium]